MAILDRKSPGQPDFFSSQVMSARRFFRPDAAEAADCPEDTEETRGGIFRVISGGLERCVPGYEVRRESFPYWALEFVVSGTGSLTLDDRGFELKAGTLYAKPAISSVRGVTIQEMTLPSIDGGR